MEVKKISKERLGAKVLFPRTQLAGLRCDDREQMPARQDFTLETIQDVPGMGQAHIIVETAAPRMQFQLILTPQGEEQFDDHLGKLLGMHEPPSYIEGRTDFMVLFIGSKDGQDITQENHREVYQRICQRQDQAARWWHLYGCEK